MALLRALRDKLKPGGAPLGQRVVVRIGNDALLGSWGWGPEIDDLKEDLLFEARRLWDCRFETRTADEHATFLVFKTSNPSRAATAFVPVVAESPMSIVTSLLITDLTEDNGLRQVWPS